MRKMEHSEAVRLKAAERYLLGELNGELRDQYEEHVFSCAECAEDVKSGVAFMDSAREVLSAEETAAPAFIPTSPRSERWFGSWLRPAFAVPAFAVLVLFVAYQNAVKIPHLKSELSQASAPQTLPTFSLLTLNSRGGEPLKIMVRPDRPFGIFVDIPPEKRFSYYQCDLENEAGRVELSLNVSSEEARQTVQLLIPPSRLGPGRHVLVVRGLDSPQGADASKIEVARFPFTLEYSK
jgi:hypothetical protein